MSSAFYEMFYELKPEGEYSGVLKNATVEKIGTNSRHDAMNIYLNFDALIPKRRIWNLESEIKKKYFDKSDMDVRIIEHFTLSSQYDMKTLYDAYRDSILEELYKKNSVTYGIIKNSDLDITDEGDLFLTMEDTVIAHEKEGEIKAFFYQVIESRCGIPLKIIFSYKPPKKSKYLEKKEKQLSELVSDITENYNSIKREQEEKAEENSAEKPKRAVKSFGERTAQEEKKQSDNNKNSSFKGDSFKGNRDFSKRKKSNDPDVIFGDDVEDAYIDIEEVKGELGAVTVRGEVLSTEIIVLKKDETRAILKLCISDHTDSIGVTQFMGTETAKELEGKLKAKTFIRLTGTVRYDDYAKDIGISALRGIKLIPDFFEKRKDLSDEKRVELHCHTKMSDMDGVTYAKDLVKAAISFGHPALAITDHGVAQAFPEAMHAAEGNDDFKVIYGVEAYLADDEKSIVTNENGQDLSTDYVVFDLETTGFSAAKNRIIEIGAVRVEDGKITDRFSEFVNPEVPIPYRITELTSITDAMVIDAERIEDILPRFIEFSKDAVMVAHNADFDMSFIRENCNRQNLPCPETYIDTVELSKTLFPNLKNYKLDTVAAALNVVNQHHHRAVDDAECTAEFFVKELMMLGNMKIDTLKHLNSERKITPEQIKKIHPYHTIILAKNDIGRINLYRLISESHLNYFGRKPNMPKSLIKKYREGLIIGSACSEGELYEAIMNGRPEREIVRIASFYDYLEIQPIGNNGYLLRSDKYPVESEEELREINRKIVQLGKDLNKPVCATCDVHFLNPEDEIYRRFIQDSKDMSDCDEQPPLYLRTTEEMLEEFSYLGAETAHEVVIENTNKIARMCEKISPVRPDKCPPVIENSDETLRKICYDKAHEIYGENLPEIVSERLERELNSIISNGYAVMYIIAQKLVWKSNEDGYLVGSRGSVGSSFVATMAGITEVNPLQAHYICKSCHYTDFDSELVKSFSGRAGCDMPDKDCPVCGKKLVKEGFDIPFETFLGFKGDKEPDIDLNFSGEYQAKAHRYTEVIFGEGQTFKAGTVSGVADKTAYAYVKKYYEKRGIRKRAAEIDRLLVGCTDVRKTTGQHPGGIIVLPVGEEINTFTPVQHPPKDDQIITTHFDYHSIDSNLLKLDILGHDDPTMIRRLEDLIGINAREIPLDDKGVMSLFQNTDAIKVSPDDLFHFELGTLGIPEFGTDFAKEMLIDTKPQEFTDLVRIAGLAHGTDVWLGNAQELILSGKATISTAICTRDDIMIYLINKGMDPEKSFKIMENVRKGAVAKGKCKTWDEWKEDMIVHDVPDWYIWSCEQIKYMFPKAHAAAYVMMAWRVAYCKVYHPLEYYTAYYSVRADGFDYEKMCFGREKLRTYLNEYYERDNSDDKSQKLSATEKLTYRDMRIVDEMYARGFSFLPIDLYESDPRDFKIVDGKILPSFSSIAGLGENVAETLSIAAKQGKFSSLDDIRERGKLSKTMVDKFKELNITGDLPESNQLSLFDMM